MEGHWSQRKDRFTGLAHGFNVLLELRRGGYCDTKLAEAINNYELGRVVGDGPIPDTVDKSRRGASYSRVAVVDADEGAFGDTRVDTFAEVHVTGTSGYGSPREGTHNHVVSAGCDTTETNTIETPGLGAHNRVGTSGGPIRGLYADSRVVKGIADLEG